MIRNATAWALTATTLATGTGCTSVLEPENENVDPASEAVTTLDGETVFRGIFFGNGPAAKRLPEIWGIVPLAGLLSQTPAALAAELDLAVSTMKGLASKAVTDRLSKMAADLRARPAEAAAVMAANRTALQWMLASGQMPSTVQVDDTVRLLKKNDPAYFTNFGKVIRSNDKSLIDARLREIAKQISLLPVPGWVDPAPWVGTDTYTAQDYYVAAYVAAVAVIVAVVVAVVPLAVPPAGSFGDVAGGLQRDVVVGLIASRFKA